jgi:hypothetical protein
MEWLPQSDGCGLRAFSSRIRGLARAVKPGQRRTTKEEWKFGLFLFWEGFSDITAVDGSADFSGVVGVLPVVFPPADRA